jgi:NAD(P)-dependent dehydrogenase (short-subunit alcohol dehydrogenase family)
MGQHNKTALVTGASRGIGRATALALAQQSTHVLVHYGRSAKEAESLVSEIQTKGGSANAISTDLGIPSGAEQLAKQVRSIVGDRLDVLVLNAGISKAARVAVLLYPDAGHASLFQYAEDFGAEVLRFAANLGPGAHAPGIRARPQNGRS